MTVDVNVPHKANRMGTTLLTVFLDSGRRVNAHHILWDTNSDVRWQRVFDCHFKGCQLQPFFARDMVPSAGKGLQEGHFARRIDIPSQGDDGWVERWDQGWRPDERHLGIMTTFQETRFLHDLWILGLRRRAGDSEDYNRINEQRNTSKKRRRNIDRDQNSLNEWYKWCEEQPAMNPQECAMISIGRLWPREAFST